MRRRNTNTPTVAAIKRPQRGSHACVAASVVMMDRALAQTDVVVLGASSFAGDVASSLGTMLGIEGVVLGVVGVIGR